MKDIWKFIKQKLVTTQKFQKYQANKIRKNSFDYKVEDLVWLSIKNIKTNRSSKKLNHKMIDFYKVLKVLKEACQLELSQSMKIHDTFHIFLLRSASTDLLIEQIQSSSSSIIVNEEKKYEVNDILNNRYHYNKLQYRVLVEMMWIESTSHHSNSGWCELYCEFSKVQFNSFFLNYCGFFVSSHQIHVKKDTCSVYSFV
jgi:hypothetical protein